MKRIYLIILLTICTYNVGSDKRKCFSFTWIGSSINEENCTNDDEYCIEPIYNDTMVPDTDEMWDYINNNNNDTGNPDYPDESITDCDLTCIKYTYIYNGRVINASYFCGKVIEDQTIAVTTGCYVTHTEGYTIEACACESKAGEKPCNLAIRNTYSISIIFMAIVSLFIYKILNIP